MVMTNDDDYGWEFTLISIWFYVRFEHSTLWKSFNCSLRFFGGRTHTYTHTKKKIFFLFYKYFFFFTISTEREKKNVIKNWSKPTNDKKKKNTTTMRNETYTLSHTTKMDMGLHGMRWKIRLNDREQKIFQFSFASHARCFCSLISLRSRSELNSVVLSLVVYALGHPFVLDAVAAVHMLSFSIFWALSSIWLSLIHSLIHFSQKKRNR